MYRLGFEDSRFFPQQPEHNEPIPRKPLSPAAFIKLSLVNRMKQVNAALDGRDKAIKKRVAESAKIARGEIEKPRKKK